MAIDSDHGRAAQGAHEHALVLRGATIVDGTGAPRFTGDIGIDGGRIARVAEPGTLAGAATLDASGRISAPGFIDIHSHADFTLLVDGRAHNCVLQGVTSVVTGNCGHGIAPVTARSRDLVPMNIPGWGAAWDEPVSWRSFGEYLDAVRGRGVAVNLFPLVAHGALRLAVSGFEDRALDPREIDAMRAMTDEAMAAGAIGFSTGLEYAPGIAADEAELARVCEPVGAYDGIYATHCRDRAAAMTAAAAEAVGVAEHAGARLQLSHFVRRPWAPAGEPERAMDLLAAAEQRGVTVRYDVFPFDYGPTPLAYVLPAWARHGSRAEIAERLASAVVRARILEDLGANFAAALESDIAETMYVAADGADGSFVGRTLGTIARERGESVAEAALTILARAGESFYCTAIVERWVDWGDLTGALGDPRLFIMGDGASGGLDGPLSDYTFTLSDWGFAPAFLGRFVRGMGLVSLEAAIERMTAGPARQIGLADRGRIAEGCAADLVIFDPETVDSAVAPDGLRGVPTGIDHVLVNGEFVVRCGRPTDRRPGRVGLAR